MSDEVDEYMEWMDQTIHASLRCIRTHHELVMEHTLSLRSGHGCVIQYPTKETGYDAGSRSLHLGIEWDDGKHWLLRIKHDANAKTKAARRMMIESEVATMSLMAQRGLPVPNAWACPPLTMTDTDSVYMWCLMERMEGDPFYNSNQRDLEVGRNVVNGVADFFIQLSALPLEGIGALSPSTEGHGEVVIGPGDIYLPLRDDYPTDPPTANLLGPWHTGAEYHIAYLKEVLRRTKSPSDRYPGQIMLALFNLEARQIIEQDADLTRVQPTYICHGDPNCDHILRDEKGNVTAIIDWEFCTAVPFSEAFQAPIGFGTLDELEKGQVELFPLEAMLEKTLREKGRDDLADCVAKGRKWHLLRVAPGLPDQLDLTNTFRRLWLGDGARQFETVEEWKAWALEEFRDHQELQRFL